MTVPPLLPSQSSVHTLLALFARVSGETASVRDRRHSLSHLGSHSMCIYVHVHYTHMHTTHIYVGEKEKKKKKIFPLRRTEMNLENKRQNEISQIDRYLYVKSKQSNRSRRHSRHSQGLEKG